MSTVISQQPQRLFYHILMLHPASMENHQPHMKLNSPTEMKP